MKVIKIIGINLLATSIGMLILTVIFKYILRWEIPDKLLIISFLISFTLIFCIRDIFLNKKEIKNIKGVS